MVAEAGVPVSSRMVGATSMCAARALTSLGWKRPGRRQKEMARMPPMNAVPFCARIPALKTLVPAVPPLSFMKTTKVS